MVVVVVETGGKKTRKDLKITVVCEMENKVLPGSQVLRLIGLCLDANASAAL